MASNSKKITLKISSSSCSPKTPSKSQSQTPPPPPPPPSPGLTYQVVPELQRLYDQVFKSVPAQTPHFNPLSEFSDDLKEGLILGSRLAFLNLGKKFQNCDPSTFLSEADFYNRQFKQFEVMGYDVSNLKDRFKLLKRKVEQQKLLRDAVDELEEEEKQNAKKIEVDKLLLEQLKSECVKLQKGIEENTTAGELIISKKRKIMDDSNRNLNEFRKLAKTPL